MTRPGKTVEDSYTSTTELVLPNDTNPLGTLFGGRLLSMMDKAAAICARRHAGTVSVTAAIDSVEFHKPLYQGDVLLIEAWVNRTFRTSMEIQVSVATDSFDGKNLQPANSAFFTFVAIDRKGSPVPVQALQPTTKKQEQRWRQAGLRREVRLYLSGRLTLKDAPQVQDELLAVLQMKDL